MEPWELTYLQLSGRNGNEVHVVQAHHVDDPHLLIVDLLELIKLTEGQQKRVRLGQLTQQPSRVQQNYRGPQTLSYHKRLHSKHSPALLLSINEGALDKLLQPQFPHL
jgi:hypothetical protein